MLHNNSNHLHQERSLIIKHGVKYYHTGKRKYPVLENFNFELRTGDRLSIMGPNGCGKSTLINVLAGIDHLDFGNINLKFQKQDLIGVILQNYRRQLLPWDTVENNILLPYQFNKQIDDSATILKNAEEFLHELNYHISLSTRVNHLSGGEQQAVILARTLAYGSNLFLWDEPFSAIDYSKRSHLYSYLLEYWKVKKSTVLIVTHNLDDALALANKLIVFDERMSVILHEAIPNNKSDQFQNKKSEIWSRITGRE